MKSEKPEIGLFKYTTLNFLTKTIDTSFFHIGQLNGRLYQFESAGDSNYITLSYRIGAWDMGQANCNPIYDFKEHVNSGIFLIHINGNAEKMLEFRNHQLYSVCWLNSKRCCTLPPAKIETLDSITQITNYQINIDCNVTIRQIRRFTFKNGLPQQENKHIYQGDIKL